MRKLWIGDCKDLGWVDPISQNLQSEWHQLFLDMFEVEKIYFKRCIKPEHTTSRNPILLIFCDSSEAAFGACAYVRWELNDGSFKTQLLLAKSQVAPINTITIVKMEENSAPLGAR